MNRKYASSFASEYELREKIIGVLRARGIHPFVEIPFLGRNLDLAYKCKDGSITTIEVKRFPKHIKEGIQQAKICLLGADRVYVCMPEYNVTQGTKNIFMTMGIGLIFLREKSQEDSLQFIVPASRSRKKLKFYSLQLRNTLKQRRK